MKEPDIDALWEEFIKIPRYEVEDQKIFLSCAIQAFPLEEVWGTLESYPWLIFTGDPSYKIYPMGDENFDMDDWTECLFFEEGSYLYLKINGKDSFGYVVTNDSLDETEVVGSEADLIHVFCEEGLRHVLIRDPRPIDERDYTYLEDPDFD